MITKTTNRLYFSVLDPLRFEDLCFDIVSRIKDMKKVNHFGRQGNDGGVDIHAIQMQNKKEKHWFIQCKRYIKISKKEIKEIIEKIVLQKTLPDKLLLIIACDASRNLYNFFKDECLKNRIFESEMWWASDLEAFLYNDHKDLLQKYFGFDLADIRKLSNDEKVKSGLEMQKRIEQDFLNHEFINNRENSKRLMHEPFWKFISDSVIIHSIDDSEYPSGDIKSSNKISPWFRTFLYDLYHNGIEVWLNASVEGKIIMDESGNWEYLRDYYDKRQEEKKYKVFDVKAIGRIPYYNIVGYKLEGDEYYSEPHIFCRFDLDDTPYEKIYYKISGNLRDNTYDIELKESKKTVFK